MSEGEPVLAHEKAVVYESAITRERVEMSWPPTDLVDWEELRYSLKIPDWVDLSDRTVRQGVVGLWSQQRRTEGRRAAGGHKEAVGSAKLIGGVAFRILCRSANAPGGFRRPLKDVDYLVSHRAANDFLESLLGLGDWAGSSYLHFLLAEDRQYNALRGGKRFRVRAVSPSSEGLPIQSRVTDIFVGGLQFCHRLPVGDLEQPGLTIALPELMLTKLQFIKRVSKEAVGEAHEYRVLEPLGKHEVALGMEDKDILDVAAAFLDSLDADNLAAALCHAVEEAGDWGLWKTTLMNLTNSRAVTSVLRDHGVSSTLVGEVNTRMADTADRMTRTEPRRRMWGRRSVWFDEVEDT